MVSFNTVYPSTRHPSLLSPSVLTILPSFLSFLYPPVCCLSLWSGGNARSMYRHICLNCQHQPPPLTLPLLFPSSLSCYSSSSYFFYFFFYQYICSFSLFFTPPCCRTGHLLDVWKATLSGVWLRYCFCVQQAFTTLIFGSHSIGAC